MCAKGCVDDEEGVRCRTRGEEGGVYFSDFEDEDGGGMVRVLWMFARMLWRGVGCVVLRR